MLQQQQPMLQQFLKQPLFTPLLMQLLSLKQLQQQEVLEQQNLCHNFLVQQELLLVKEDLLRCSLWWSG